MPSAKAAVAAVAELRQQLLRRATRGECGARRRPAEARSVRARVGARTVAPQPQRARPPLVEDVDAARERAAHGRGARKLAAEAATTSLLSSSSLAPITPPSPRLVARARATSLLCGGALVTAPPVPAAHVLRRPTFLPRVRARKKALAVSPQKCISLLSATRRFYRALPGPVERLRRRHPGSKGDAAPSAA